MERRAWRSPCASAPACYSVRVAHPVPAARWPSSSTPAVCDTMRTSPIAFVLLLALTLLATASLADAKHRAPIPGSRKPRACARHRRRLTAQPALSAAGGGKSKCAKNGMTCDPGAKNPCCGKASVCVEKGAGILPPDSPPGTKGRCRKACVAITGPPGPSGEPLQCCSCCTAVPGSFGPSPMCLVDGRPEGGGCVVIPCSGCCCIWGGGVTASPKDVSDCS